VRYSFVTIGDLANVNERETVDLLAIIQDVGEVTSIHSQKTNRPLIKREVTLVDPTAFSTRLTLWGTTAETFQVPAQNSVIALKNVTVSNFNGMHLVVLVY